MSKETLQHTMRSKVRVFEDGGIRLLRKGQKGLIHAIFSRFGLVLVLLVLQFGALFSLMRWFSNLLPHYLGGTLLVTAAMMVYLLNQDMNNSVRIPWLVVTALAPVLGVLLFCYTKEDVGHRMLKKRLLVLEDCVETGCVGQRVAAMMAQLGMAPRRLVLKNTGDRFIPQGSVAELRHLCGLDAESVAAAAEEAVHEQ